MRLLCIAIITSLFFIGCHNADPAPSATTAKNNVNEDPLHRKKKLITALQDLQKAIAARDRQKITALFHFPIPDSVMMVFSDDSSFKADEKKQRPGLSKEFFTTWFDKVLSNWQPEEFDSLFLHLDLQNLMQKDSLGYNAIRKTEPCYKYYTIECSQDSLIHIAYGINSNAGYVAKKEDAEETPDGVCEHLTYWDLIFDGERLQVVRQGGAD